MNISMNMSNDEHGGPRQTLTITATDEDASQLALLLKMAGMGGGDDMSHGAVSGGGEVCAGCGMADCGCGDMEQMDEAEGALNWKSMITPNASVGELRDMFEKYNISRSIADFLEYAKDARNLGQAMQYFDKKSLEDEDYGRRVDREYGGNVSSGYYQLQDLMSEQMDETYGDNVVDMNSPNYPTNTESAQDNFGYSGGLNKPKRDVAGNGQTTVPVTAVRGQDDNFQESIQRMREIAGIKETPSIFFPDPKDTAKQLGIKAQSRLIDTPTPMSTGSNRSYNNTFLDPAQKAQQRLSKQNESIFTDTANLWKSYKG